MTEKIKIDYYESYPVFGIDEDNLFDITIEVPDGFTERLWLARQEWDACQKILTDAYEKAKAHV